MDPHSTSRAILRTKPKALPLASPVNPAPHRGIVGTSYAPMALALFVVMGWGLLPGLLCVCLGFLLTQGLTRLFVRTWARLRREPWLLRSTPRWAEVAAAALVMLLPLALLATGLTQSRTYIIEAPQQYRELMSYLAETVLELRQKLPPDLAVHLPEGVADVQRVLANVLGAQAGALALAGRAWLGGILFAYVGLLIGALAAIRKATAHPRPLAQELAQRVTLFGEAFQQIVAAQFWIAAFNTLLTAVFLLLVLPHWDLGLPYTPVLITLTFVAGLVPIVGNLLCNVVLTLVGLSVSPVAAAACLGFLILIHKAEYVINAKVVGQRTQMGVWELLSVMFIAEAIYGPAGLVAAPLFYAYLKKELVAARLV